MNEKIEHEATQAQLEYVAESARCAIAGKLAIVIVAKDQEHEGEQIEAVYMGVSDGKSPLGGKGMAHVGAIMSKIADGMLNRFTKGRYRLMLATPEGLKDLAGAILEIRTGR